MNPLSNPNIIKHIMQRHNITFNKKYGQNFLTDEDVLGGIVEKSGLTKDDYVLEIGPGIGTLTYELAQNAQKVVSVEIDKGLIPVLSDTLSEFDNIEIINQDILKTDITALIEEKFCGEMPYVIANLPYYITSPIIMHLLESGIAFKKIVVMVQKEVAERIASAPGTKDYGVLTIATQFYSDTSVLFDVPRTSFIPAPNVDSAILQMVPRPHPTCQPSDNDVFFKTVKSAFALRRKTILNSISGSGMFPLSKAQIENAIVSAGIAPSARGETVSLEQFATLSDRLRNV